jgi:cobalt-zinc-cadmium efflux system protein
VPQGIDAAQVRAWLTGLPGVVEVHDLHIWAMSTTETALTAHLIRPAGGDGDDFLHAACEGLAERYGIGHATLQVETGETGVCRLSSAEAV